MKGSHFASGLTLLALASLSSVASGQSAQVNSQLSAWRAEHGASWQVRGWYDHSYARMLYGGKTEAAFVPVSDADYVDLARSYVDQTGAMFAVDNSVLAEDSVVLLPLGATGSSDKMTVRFTQEVNGVPVEYGSVNVLMNMEGGLLSVDARSLPNVAVQSTVPTVAANDALQVALADFRAETGTPETSTSMVELNIIRQSEGGVATPALAWRVQVSNIVNGFEPESFVYQIAAQGTASVLRRENGIHHFDVGGTVSTNATIGLKPDTASNPPGPVPAAYMTVSAQGAGTTTTDANGDFNFAGLNGPVNVTFSYKGLYNDVRNSAGGELSLTQSLSGTGNLVTLNASPTSDNTAQSNGFYSINRMRDWIRSINASDGMMDFVNLMNTNINSSCNAFYDGSSTNFYRPGGGCVNTAYANVIYHEQGHWLNDRYNSGNGFDGFGEGNADVYATYQENSPIVGVDFFGPGTLIRDGNNTRAYCGDGNGGCYGEVHNDGEVLMGALWKVRSAIQASVGDQVGGDIANALHSGWMNAYDQGTIDSIVETQWLTLDDDNGDINDGTPNYDDINDGFLAQSFPGVFIGGSQATAASRNGSGANPDVFVSTSLPIIGTSWTSTIDGNGLASQGAFSFALYFSSPLNTGLTVSLGELLVDPTSGLLGQTDATFGGSLISSHSISIPGDIALDSLPVSVQAVIPSAGTLTNAVDLSLGTF